MLSTSPRPLQCVSTLLARFALMRRYALSNLYSFDTAELQIGRAHV